MKWNFNIGTKIATGFGTVLILLALIGTLGIWQLSKINRDYQEKVLTAKQQANLSIQMREELLQVRRGEKDFLARKDEKYIAAVKGHLDKIRKIAEDMKKSADANSQVSLEQVIAHAEGYGTEWKNLTQAVIDRGLTENLGLQGKFRAAAHNLAEIMAKNNMDKGTILYLDARKHEKDYMLRENQKYVGSLKNVCAQLRNLVMDSRLAASAKLTSTNLLSVYEEDFLNLVKKDSEITSSLEKAKAEADKALDIAEQLGIKMEKLAVQNEADITAAASASKTFLWIVSLLAVVIGIIFALYLSRLIVGPLKSMAGVANGLSQGNLEQKINVKSNDEVGQLARSFTQMIHAQQDMARAASEIAAGNLSTQVNILSDKDVLGNAMLAMRDGLAKAQDEQKKILADTEFVVTTVANVMQKASKKDLSVRIEQEFQGKFAQLKTNVNQTLDNLDEALNQVQLSVEQVTSASNQINSSSQTLAQGAQEQASSLEEISSSLEEMASMTRQNADNASQAKNLADGAQSTAVQGNQAMETMTAAINRIKNSSDETAKIVKTIDEIAFQTNLLALNAAVEAARAGEAGMGFAVVAEEVRNLASRSAEAAKNTANMIEESVRNAESGVSITKDVAKYLEEIKTGTQKMNDLVSEISAASTEQSRGIDQVNESISQLNQITQQNASNSEESASAAEELSSQSQELNAMVNGFALSRGRTAPAKNGHLEAEAKQTLEWIRTANGNGKSKTNGKTVSVSNFMDASDADLEDF